jgi:3-phosphoshikimate 1-carboxyvinyltransferase
LVPILAVLYCFRRDRENARNHRQYGEHLITGAKRLRDKESDRLFAIASELNRLGAQVTELPDGLLIREADSLAGGEVVAHNDHRIAMALAIAATRCDGPVTIDGAECVAKSYPEFFEHYRKLKQGYTKI